MIVFLHPLKRNTTLESKHSSGDTSTAPSDNLLHHFRSDVGGARSGKTISGTAATSRRGGHTIPPYNDRSPVRQNKAGNFRPNNINDVRKLVLIILVIIVMTLSF